jgi:sugar (pentulose or hexulose) kinase
VSLPSDLLLGVDLGTGSMKGVAVTTSGELVAEARTEYPMHHPQPGWNENDTQDWVLALQTVVRRLASAISGRRVRALGLVAQRDPLVMLDDAGLPTAPVISWTDRRTEAELARLTGLIGHCRLIEITGGRPVVGGGLLNLMWAREHTPEAWQRTVRAAAPKDYLLGLLGAEPGTESTTPTRSIAFDVRQRRWSTEVLDAVQICPEMFDRPVHQPWDAVGTLSSAWANRLGLDGDVVLAAGSADDHAAALGSGAAISGQRSLGTGTCSSWRAVTDSYLPDPEGRTDCSPYVVPELFMREATIDSVGSSLRWFRDAICPELPAETAYDQILAMAASAPRGAEGAQFFPFVDGAQRAPFFQQGATAAFLGITSRHTRAHLARAMVESVAMLYIPTLALMGDAGDAPLTIVDGEAASPFWNQVKADVMGCPVRTPEVPHAAAMGAAALASVAAGLHDDVPAAAAAMIRWTPAHEPDPVAHAHYQDQWHAYRRTFEALRPVYEAGRS